MIVKPISAFTDNYIWMIVDPNQKQALCIDPGDAAPVMRFLKEENLKLKAILLTHHHNDHIGGVAALIHAYPYIPVYGPLDSRIPEVTQVISAGKTLALDGCEFQIINTPGHTSSHISLYEPKQGWLFCGDTLFSAGCGRVFDGTIEQLHQSLQALKKLPEQTKVYCAHEYTAQNLRFARTVEPNNRVIQDLATKLAANPTRCSLPSTIKLEKEINPFFRTEIEETQHFAKQAGCKHKDSLSIFAQLRASKNTFS